MEDFTPKLGLVESLIQGAGKNRSSGSSHSPLLDIVYHIEKLRIIDIVYDIEKHMIIAKTIYNSSDIKVSFPQFAIDNN